MAKLFCLVLLFVTVGCTYENKKVEESCTINGRAVDCREMEERRTPPGKATPIPDPNKTLRFQCGRTTCDSVAEFCFRFEDSSGRLLSASCQAQDLNCRDCECLTKRVLAAYPDDCASARICHSIANEQYTFSCRQPLQFNPAIPGN